MSKIAKWVKFNICHIGLYFLSFILDANDPRVKSVSFFRLVFLHHEEGTLGVVIESSWNFNHFQLFQAAALFLHHPFFIQTRHLLHCVSVSGLKSIMLDREGLIEACLRCYRR